MVLPNVSKVLYFARVFLRRGPKDGMMSHLHQQKHTQLSVSASATVTAAAPGTTGRHATEEMESKYNKYFHF